MSQKLENLTELLERIGEGADTADTGEEKVALNTILGKVGRRSFGPLLLLAGLITLAPIIGDIPGVPTMMGVFVLLTAGQLLFHKEHMWLPDWILKRSVKRETIYKVLGWLRKPARFLDRWLHPRFRIFVKGIGLYIIAVVCVIIAMAMPFMEVVPFSANGAGGALTAFGLSLITHDGLLALLALVIALGTFGVIVYNFL